MNIYKYFDVTEITLSKNDFFYIEVKTVRRKIYKKNRKGKIYNLEQIQMKIPDWYIHGDMKKK